MSQPTPNDPFALFRQLWQNAGPAMQPFMPPLNEEEIERKLNELKVIEGWLNFNLSMLTMQMKALEVQKAGLAALKPKEGTG